MTGYRVNFTYSAVEIANGRTSHGEVFWVQLAVVLTLIVVALEAITAVSVNMQISCGDTPFRLVNNYRTFGGSVFRSFGNSLPVEDLNIRRGKCLVRRLYTCVDTP